VADIFRAYGEAYRSAHQLTSLQLKIMRDIERCRTAELGGHLERCDDGDCGFERPAYNSCLNRHCPKCQTVTKARWLEARRAELLPVGYFHLVFTLPHELNPLALVNKKAVYGLLFQAAAATLQDFAADPKHLGGTTGFTAILHTWDQQLRTHIHLHCVVPGGALSPDGSRWIKARKHFLFPVKALSKVFRGKFVEGLKKLFHKEKLSLQGKLEILSTPEGLSAFFENLYAHKWVVYSKKPFGGPEKVLDYLGRYTHRIAIANHRLVHVQNGKVTFKYRDRKHGNQLKECTLSADEFIRRFLHHSVPKGFFRIRHFGFLANKTKKRLLAQCRRCLGLSPKPPVEPPKDLIRLLTELTGIDHSRCPRCGRGTMRVVMRLPKPAQAAGTPIFCGRSPP
jgi:hypothetical protein